MQNPVLLLQNSLRGRRYKEPDPLMPQAFVVTVSSSEYSPPVSHGAQSLTASGLSLKWHSLSEAQTALLKIAITSSFPTLPFSGLFFYISFLTYHKIYPFCLLPLTSSP